LVISSRGARNFTRRRRFEAQIVSRSWPRDFSGDSLYDPATGPVAQGIEQQPSKLKVAGSNPAGVANKISHFSHFHLPDFLHGEASGKTSQAEEAIDF
jgi:hypothetical protein